MLTLARSWTRLQRWLIVSTALALLLTFGALIWVYERYYRGPGEEVLYGLWEVPDSWTDERLYFEFRPDHGFAAGGLHDGQFDAYLTGRWYAGGRFIYFRFVDKEFGSRRPFILHIVDIQHDELRVRYHRAGSIVTYRRVHSGPQSASNQAMQRTASKPASEVLRGCHPRFRCVARGGGLAVADLGSR